MNASNTGDGPARKPPDQPVATFNDTTRRPIHQPRLLDRLTWAFVRSNLGDGRTRYVFRSRGRARPAWVAAAYLLVIIPADFVMSRQMLRGVKAQAERTTAADLPAAKAARHHDRLP